MALALLGLPIICGTSLPNEFTRSCQILPNTDFKLQVATRLERQYNIS